MLLVLVLRRSILTEKVARRGYHVTREYSVDPLTMVRVGEVMDRNVPTVPASMRLIDLSDRIASHDPQVARHQGLLIVDDNRKLAGIITRGDILRALERSGDNGTTVLDAGSPDPVVTFTMKSSMRRQVKCCVITSGDCRWSIGATHATS
jgi:CBS domain-containing protein